MRVSVASSSKTVFLVIAVVLGTGTANATTTPRKRSQTVTKVSASANRLGRHSRSSRHLRHTKARQRGQKNIQSDRAREIQEALIREHYLQGEPNGVWDQRTKDAMARYQADHGWQTRSLPDARALIKLGLGPDHKNVLNPETAATNPPVRTMPAAALPMGLGTPQ